MPGADVVQDHQEAVLAQRVRERPEAAHVLETRLEKLDGDVAGKQVRAAHQRRQRRGQIVVIVGGGEIQVQEQQKLVGARGAAPRMTAPPSCGRGAPAPPAAARRRPS